MIRAVYGLMGLGMCLLSAPAMANLSLVNYNGFEIRQSGNTWSFSHEPPSSTSLRGGTVLRGVSVSGTQPALVASHTINAGKGIPVEAVAVMRHGALARAVVAAAKVATPIGAAVTAVELLKYMNENNLLNIKNTENGLQASIKNPDAQISEGKAWWVYDIGITYHSPEAACASVAGANSVVTGPFDGGLTMGCSKKLPNGSTEWVSTMRWYTSTRCPAGWYINGDTCSPDNPMKVINEQEMIDKMASDSGWPTSAAIAAQKAINMRIPIPTEAPTVSGPSSVAGEKSTKTESVNLNPGSNTPSAPGASNTDPGTKTTTTTTTTNVTYSGSNVSTTTNITTVTNITNNITNNTTTTTSNENKSNDQPSDPGAGPGPGPGPQEPVDDADDEPEDPPVDTPLGDIPELYKKKYPDGIAGVLNSKIAQLKATPLFNLPSLLMPALPSSGSCPSWQVDLSLSSWADMGTHTIEAPCMVWDFGKVVIIVSALLLARRLIFGG